ncbi:uncharacterized protein IL334_000516 [Kwoniella shivajii]|uniref:Uncharacterized protein n=1 Tax=Kwoniella shivajii TaxID=564305 RepID=A0ABZ1CPC6_9TREE|nr:hypothetical protein IL334_000516 [Kwoniella shivajii]
MPSSSKIIALSLIAGATAAPLNIFGTSSGKTSTSVNANANANASAGVNTAVVGDITGFTNALLSSATGGAVTVVDKVESQFGTAVGIARTIAMNTWASGQCLATYHDINMCTEISAYLPAVYYAFEQGWSAAQLFAALGADRVNKFQNLLSSLCAHAEASSTCSPLLAAWPSYVTASAQVDAAIIQQASSQLLANGIITLIDATHTGTSLISGLTSGVMANANAMVGSATGLHLRDMEEQEMARRFLGLENIFGHAQASATATAAAAAQATATAAANANAQAQAAGALNVANLVNAAGSLTAGAATQAGAGAGASAQGAGNIVTGLTSNIPVVGGLVNGLPLVGGLTSTVQGVVSTIPVVGGVAQTATNLAAGLTGQAQGAAGLATNLIGGLNVPGLASLSGQVSGVANTATAASASAAGLGGLGLGSATHLLGLRDLGFDISGHLPSSIVHTASGLVYAPVQAASGIVHDTAHKIASVGNGLDLDLASEIAEGDVFAHLSAEHKRDLLSGLLSNPAGILNNVPVVGGLTNGLLGGVTNNLLGGVTNGVLGGVTGGLLSNPTGAVGGLINTVTHLPVVGNVASGVLNTVGNLPVVGNVAAQATGALSSATNAGLNIGQNGLNLGLNDVTQAAGGLVGGAGIHLKRGLLDGLPLLGALPVGQVLNGLPVVNSLPIGGILSNPVGTVENTVNSLPVVGGLLHGLTANLPIVGGLTAQAGAQGSAAANGALNLGAGGLSAALNGVTSAVGSVAGTTGVHLGQRDLLSGLLGGSGSGSGSSGLPLIGNNLPVVGPLINGLTSNLPIVGNAGGLLSGVTNTVGQLTGTVGNTVSGLTHNLPVVGNLVDGLTHSLPLIGAQASAAAQGSVNSATNAGLNLGANGLSGTLNSVTGLVGGLVGGGNLHIKKSLIDSLPIVNGVASHLPIVNSIPIVGNGQFNIAGTDGLNVQLGPIQAQAQAAIDATQHGVSSILGAGLKVGDIINAQGQGVIGALIH